MSNSKQNPEINANELIIVKQFLQTPMPRAELEKVTGFKYLQKKLKIWCEKGELFREDRIENKLRYIYFSDKPFKPRKIEIKPIDLPKPDPDAPSEKWIEQNGNSRIIRPTLNANYGHQMSLYRKTKQEVWVASSLSSF